MRGRLRGRFGILRGRRGKTVGLVKNRRLMAMQKQRRAKASKPRFAIIDTRNRKEAAELDLDKERRRHAA